MTNNEVQKPDDATLILKRVLNAPPERAFRAWTSAEHIQEWMRPEPGMPQQHGASICKNRNVAKRGSGHP